MAETNEIKKLRAEITETKELAAATLQFLLGLADYLKNIPSYNDAEFQKSMDRYLEKVRAASELKQRAKRVEQIVDSAVENALKDDALRQALEKLMLPKQ